MHIVFNSNKRKHEAELKRYDELGFLHWKKYQDGNSLQTVYTPLNLVLEMLNKLDTVDGKDIAVIANVEIFSFLKALKKYKHINYNSITFITDIKSLEGKENIEVVDFNKISYINLNMKFDVVIGNPPFNNEGTVRDNSKRKQGRNLAKEFLYKCIEWSTGQIAIIAPVSRTYTAKVKRDFIENGLYEVTNVKQYFPKVKVDLIVTYLFDKQEKRELQDCTVFHKPERNLGQLYTFTTGKNLSRKYLEPLLSEKGKYKVYLTTGTIKYTDSEELINQIDDRTRGKLRVVMNHNSSKTNVGKMLIAKPEDVLTYSTNAFFIDTEEQGKAIIDYLQSSEAKEILLNTRQSMSNSKKSFEAFAIPF